MYSKQNIEKWQKYGLRALKPVSAIRTTPQHIELLINNMVIDQINEANKNEIIEILIENIWLPAMATDLRIMDKQAELIRVKAIRVRKLK